MFTYPLLFTMTEVMQLINPSNHKFDSSSRCLVELSTNLSLKDVIISEENFDCLEDALEICSTGLTRVSDSNYFSAPQEVKPLFIQFAQEK